MSDVDWVRFEVSGNKYRTRRHEGGVELEEWLGAWEKRNWSEPFFRDHVEPALKSVPPLSSWATREADGWLNFRINGEYFRGRHRGASGTVEVERWSELSVDEVRDGRMHGWGPYLSSVNNYWVWKNHINPLFEANSGMPTPASVAKSSDAAMLPLKVSDERGHLTHCHMGENFNRCKYGEDDTCFALMDGAPHKAAAEELRRRWQNDVAEGITEESFFNWVNDGGLGHLIANRVWSKMLKDQDAQWIKEAIFANKPCPFCGSLMHGSEAGTGRLVHPDREHSVQENCPLTGIGFTVSPQRWNDRFEDTKSYEAGHDEAMAQVLSRRHWASGSVPIAFSSITENYMKEVGTSERMIGVRRRAQEIIDGRGKKKKEI